MRALWLHYPEDERARTVADEYLWGRDLVIAPGIIGGEGTGTAWRSRKTMAGRSDAMGGCLRSDLATGDLDTLRRRTLLRPSSPGRILDDSTSA